MGRTCAAFSLYVVSSILLFGRGVIRHPTTTIVGDDGADKSLYLWSLEWWPWALRQGHNPLDADVAWAPHGYDFGLGTAGAALSLVAAPLTAAAGAVVTYNVLMLAAPALAATGAFVLARRVTGRSAPAFVAGWLFGFSSYELGRILGHLPLAFVVLVPLVALLVVLRSEEAIPRRRFVLLLAVALAAQFWIVTQLYFGLTVVAAVTAALALLLLGGQVALPTIRDAAVGWALSVPLIAPAVVYAAVSGAAAPARSPFSEAADVLNYVIPTRRTWMRPPGTAELAERFTGTGAEQGAYVGIPVVILVALSLTHPWRSRERLLAGGVLVALVALSFGTRVKVAGAVVGIGPWAVAAPLPVVGSALPARFTLYVSLVAALLVALALRDRPTVMRWGLAAAAIVLTLPNLSLPQWSSAVPRARAMSAESLRASVPPDATLLVLPYGPGGWSMHWQAEATFRVRLVGGHFALRVTPQERAWRDVYQGLNSGRVTPVRLRSFLAAHCVDAIVVAPGTSRGARRLVEAAVTRPAQHVEDSLVYRLNSCEAEGAARAAGRGRGGASFRSDPTYRPSPRTRSAGRRQPLGGAAARARTISTGRSEDTRR